MDYLTDRKSPLLWSSHIPLLQSTLDTFPITGALELGSGFHSTPVLFNRLNAVVAIENKQQWVDTLRQTIVEDDNHKIVCYPLDHNVKLYREEIGEERLTKMTQFYRENMKHKPNLLFVDHYRGYRLQAMLDLYEEMDVVIYHDAQPKVDFRYGYSKFKPNNSYFQFVDRTLQTHTGILIAKKFENLIPKFKERLLAHYPPHVAKYNVEVVVNLEQIR